jgi:hypothetical protein
VLKRWKMTDGLISGKDDGDMVAETGVGLLVTFFLSFGNRVKKILQEFNIF